MLKVPPLNMSRVTLKTLNEKGRSISVAALPLSSTPEEIIDHVILALRLNVVDRDELALLKKRWSNQLRSHMILSYGHLLHLPARYLPRLGLPLLIESELERLLVVVRYSYLCFMDFVSS